MATWYRDFSEYSTGELGTVGSADWTVTEANANWLETVTTDGAATGGQTLVLNNNGEVNALTQCYFGAAATSGDCEVYGRLKLNNVSAEDASMIAPALMGSSGGTYQLYLPSTSTVRLSYFNSLGQVAAYIDVAQSFTPSAGAYLKVRIGRSGSTIRARIWQTGDSEPGTWNAGSGTDTTLTTVSPSVVVLGYSIQPTTVDVFGAATGGDTAPSSEGGASIVPHAMAQYINQVIQ
jgi:hypothetical protein